MTSPDNQTSDPRFPDYSKHTHDPVAVPPVVPPTEPTISQPVVSPTPAAVSLATTPLTPSAPRSVIIIGAGLGGLATACLLSSKGYAVTVLEKEQEVGGWANPEEQNGFLFDRMPSMYLFPDLYEELFTLCGENIESYLKLTRLNPSHRIIFKGTDRTIDMRSDVTIDGRAFEEFEKGDAAALEQYKESCGRIAEAARANYLFDQHPVGILKNLLSPSRFSALRQAGLLSSLTGQASQISGEFLRTAMQYQALVLGSNPNTLPALYAMSTEQELETGILYPEGGFKAVAQALKALSIKHGAEYRCGQEVKKIIIKNGQAVGVELSNGQTLSASFVISNADLHQTEMQLLSSDERQYGESFWSGVPLTASALVLNLGLKGPIDQLLHHTLVMSKNWDTANTQIFYEERFASDPSFYISTPSKSDRSYAPEGQESVTIFVPIPARKHYTDEDIALYTETIFRALENDVRIEDIRERTVYQKAFCLTSPEHSTHSYGGSMFGVAHKSGIGGLSRPSVVSPAATNLFYVGANIQPGLGQAMGIAAAQQIYKIMSNTSAKGPIT